MNVAAPSSRRLFLVSRCSNSFHQACRAVPEVHRMRCSLGTLHCVYGKGCYAFASSVALEAICSTGAPSHSLQNSMWMLVAAKVRRCASLTPHAASVQAAPERWGGAHTPHMVTLVARSPNLAGSSSWGSLHHQLSISPTASGQAGAQQHSGMSQAPPAQPQPTPARKATRNEILEAFIANLRQRGSIDLDAPGVLQGIREHFQRLPTRYALDVNISTLDVLNHKRCVRCGGRLRMCCYTTCKLRLMLLAGVTHLWNVQGDDALLLQIAGCWTRPGQTPQPCPSRSAQSTSARRGAFRRTVSPVLAAWRHTMW